VTQHRFDELLQLVREDAILPEQLAELHAGMAEHPNWQRAYVRAMSFQVSLRWLCAGELPLVPSLRGAPHFRRASRRSIVRRLVWSALGGSLLLAVVLLGSFRSTDEDERQQPVIGQIESAYGQRWSDAWAGRAGALIRAGQEYALLSGTTRIRMENGVRVVLEAPCVVRPESASRLRLNRGKVLADVPVSAAGFTIRTPMGDVVDLGTQFGVLTDSGGVTEVHVFVGRVRVQHESDSGDLVSAGQARRYSAIADSRPLKEAAPSDFQSCFSFASGIGRITGRGQYTTDPAAQLGARSNAPRSTVHVFREKLQFRLPVDLPVVAPEPGEFHFQRAAPRSRLDRNRLIDAYYVHFGPNVTLETPVQCELTFLRPVVGFLLEPESLDATDRMFGLPGVNYVPSGSDATIRGTVLNSGSMPETGDRLVLSPDRRTVKLELTAGPTFVDQLRILVDAEPLDNEHR
jgi:hypothetical protein